MTRDDFLELLEMAYTAIYNAKGIKMETAHVSMANEEGDIKIDIRIKQKDYPDVVFQFTAINEALEKTEWTEANKLKYGKEMIDYLWFMYKANKI